LPFVVALTKADKPGLDVNRVKTQLAEQGVNPEEWGGKVPFVAVSAKTGLGLEDLLETILLVAELEKDKIRANADRRAVGTVIESHIDKGEGPVATVLVQSGTLRKNDELEIGGALYGRVRAMKDWNGQQVQSAEPGMPVKILGFKIAPQVGDISQVPEEGHDLKAVKKQHSVEKQSIVASAAPAKEGEEEVQRPTLKIVLKADALGSLEAILGSVEKMKTPDVAAVVVGKGLGNINESDVLRAEAVGGVVMGFNIVATREAQILARDKKVEIKVAKVIYELFDDIERRLQDLLPSEIIKTDLGKLEILANFRSDKTGQVIGGRVIDGHLEPGASVVIYHGEDPVDEGKILTLQSGKQEAKEVRMGQECGLKVSCRRPAMVGDMVHAFSVVKKERKLVLPK
jgi:translation initiation factor IF-2